MSLERIWKGLKAMVEDLGEVKFVLMDCGGAMDQFLNLTQSSVVVNDLNSNPGAQ